MKVIGGSLKGRRLETPKGRAIRPTSGKVKESIFGVVGERIFGKRILDLFSGVGSLGIEALSRGARETVFVESSHTAIRFLKKNISSLGLEDSASVIRADSLEFLRRAALDEKFDLVFADPPYSLRCGAGIVELVGALPVLKGDGLLILEHSKREVLPLESGRISLMKQRSFGETVFSIYGFKDKEER